jgi:sugar fermentation stimulation protein A
LAKVSVDGCEELVHVHDPGRLKELLYKGNVCLIRYAAGPKRKTEWDMVAARKGTEYVLVHSGYHRYISEALIQNPEISPFGKIQSLRAEVTNGDSRLDYKLIGEAGRPIWVEVKGCSLSVAGVAKFPDAPTVRGTRHLRSLMAIKASGERAAALIIVLSEADVFEPNWETDPEFSRTFYEALDSGVEIIPVQVLFNAEKGTFNYIKRLPITRPSK